jgi:hypothetical protein
VRSGRPDDGGRHALAAARAAFEPKKYSPVPADGEDAYVQQLFGNRDPLDPTFRCCAEDGGLLPSFAVVARTVFDPLLAHREVVG